MIYTCVFWSLFAGQSTQSIFLEISHLSIDIQGYKNFQKGKKGRTPLGKCSVKRLELV